VNQLIKWRDYDWHGQAIREIQSQSTGLHMPNQVPERKSAQGRRMLNL
jgi:hypothetical protein